VVFRVNGGSDCASESTSNDGVTAGDDSATTVVDKRQQTTSAVAGDAGHLVRHQIPPPHAPPQSAAAAAASTGRRHDYHQLQIAGYDAHCYVANDAVSAAATAGYLPGSGTPLSCISPYFTSNTRASVFHSNHSIDATGGLYSMQRA